MEWVWEYLIWAARRITPQGMLVGLIIGSVLTWFARGEWDEIEKGDQN